MVLTIGPAIIVGACWTVGMVAAARYCDGVSPGMWGVGGLSLGWRLWCAAGLAVLWPLYLAVAWWVSLR